MLNRTKFYNTYHEAIRKGFLIPSDRCSECGRKGPISGHHEEYDKPLAVVWLCKPCHRRADARRRAQQPTAIRKAPPFSLLDGDEIICMQTAARIAEVGFQQLHRLLKEGRFSAEQLEGGTWISTRRHAEALYNELGPPPRKSGPKGRAA